MGLLDRFRSRSRPEAAGARSSRAEPGARTEDAGAHTSNSEARARNLSAREARRDPAVRAARERFGGLDIPATLVGMLTALALLVLLAGLVGAAIGTVGYQVGLEGDQQDLSLASLIGGLIVLFLAFLVGGWAAGRIGRYSGARNGLLAAVWALILAAVLSALAALFGAEYDVLRNVNLPQWFSRDALTADAIISAIVAIVVMLLGGLLGGMWGERYHRRADALIASTREGGIVTP